MTGEFTQREGLEKDVAVRLFDRLVPLRVFLGNGRKGRWLKSEEARINSLDGQRSGAWGGGDDRRATVSESGGEIRRMNGEREKDERKEEEDERMK